MIKKIIIVLISLSLLTSAGVGTYFLLNYVDNKDGGNQLAEEIIIPIKNLFNKNSDSKPASEAISVSQDSGDENSEDAVKPMITSIVTPGADKIEKTPVPSQAASLAASSDGTRTGAPAKKPEATSAAESSVTPTKTPGGVPTKTPTGIPTKLVSPIVTKIPTPTKVPTTTKAPTPSRAPDVTVVPLITKIPTSTPTPTATNAPTPAATKAPTPTATKAPTPTATKAPTPTPTKAPTAAPTPTAIPTPTATPTPTKGAQLLAINNVSVTDMLGNSKSYFSKNERFNVSFTSSNRDSEPLSYAWINGGKYPLSYDNSNDKYTAEIMMTQLGTDVRINIDAVSLRSGTVLNTDDYEDTVNQLQDTFQIVKEVPQIAAFKYVDKNSGAMSMVYVVDDPDDAITSGDVTVYNSNGGVIATDAIEKQAIDFAKANNNYFLVKISADYALDTANRVPAVRDEILLEKAINLSDRMIELKDIKDVIVYRFTDDGYEILEPIIASEMTNPKDYFVKIETKSQGSIYAPVNRIETTGGKLYLIVTYDGGVSYTEEGRTNEIRLEIGDIEEDELVVKDTLENLLARMAADPTGDFELTHDYDAAKLTGLQSLMDRSVVFRGTLNGNGYSIYNMSAPLFGQMNGATVRNLVIQNATTSGASGILSASSVSGVTFEKIYLKNITMVNCPQISGAIVSSATNSTFNEVSVEGLTLRGGDTLGGILGQTSSGTRVTNAYAEGTIAGNSGNALGTRIGGITGWHSGALIGNCVTRITMESNTATGNGGIIGGPLNARSGSVENSISFSTGKGNRVAGSTANANCSNVYEYIGSNAASNVTADSNKIKTAGEKIYTAEFYTDEVTLDGDIWDVANAHANGYVTLLKRGANASDTKNEDVYIPEFERVKDMDDFDENKEILYNNLAILMPYYDARFIIEDAKNINVSHELNRKIIKDVIACRSNGDVIFGLSTDEKTAISYIRILYTDNSVTNYDVSYRDTVNSVANYDIPALRCGYNYDKPLVDKSNSIYRRIFNIVINSDYQRDLNPLTEENEVRNYYENYDNVKVNAEDFTINLIANTPEYQSSQHSAIDATIRDSISEEAIFRHLYAYNYMDRMYNIKINGFNLRDVGFFDGDVFSDKISPDYMTRQILGKPVTFDNNGNPSTERLTQNNVSFYNNTLKPLSNKSLGDYIEYFVTTFTSDPAIKTDPNRWFKSYFTGYAYEAPAKDFADPTKEGEFLEYRAWQHLKRQERFILAFLTYKGDDLYMATYPTAMMYGNLRMYYDWNNKPSDDVIAAKIGSFADNAARLYNTVGHLVNDATFQRMNGRADIVHDSVNNRNQTGADPIDPVFKYVNEFINQWHTHGSAAAYANTAGGVFYIFYKTLNDYTVWTHENVHNQDGYMYFEGNGRRLWNLHADSEQYADGLLTQQKDNSSLVTNFSQDYSWDENVGFNQTTSRLIGSTKEESLEKYESWYRNAYEALRLLDYLEAQALFRLDSQQKSNIVNQVNYVRYERNESGGWTPFILTPQEVADAQSKESKMSAKKYKLTKEFFDTHPINSIGDLIDNQILLERTWVKGNSDLSSGTVTNANWGVLFNDNGMVDDSFKKIAYMMAAEDGYNGFVQWCSDLNRTDLRALRAITDDDDITWKSYLLSKYDDVERRFKATYTPDEVEEYINLFKKALIMDGNNDNVSGFSQGYVLRMLMYTHFKRITNDFETSIFDTPVVTTVTSAADLIAKINDNPLGIYELGSDLDFSAVSGGDSSMITANFYGELRGNNHKITGLSKPLFNNIMYGLVEDVTFEDCSIDYNTSASKAAVVANYSKYGTLKRITATNVSVQGLEHVGAIVGYAERSLLQDILVHTDVTVAGSRNHVGGLYGSAYVCIIENNRISGATVSGNNRVGGIIGYAENNLRIEKSSAEISVSATGNDIGGLIGRSSSSNPAGNSMVIPRTFKYNTVIKECYARGTVNGNQYVGGFIGTANNTSIDRCYSYSNTTSKGGTATGGFIGLMAVSGNDSMSYVTNCIAYGNTSPGYRFDGNTPANIIEAGYSNNFEYEKGEGTSTLERQSISWDGRVGVLDEIYANNQAFYTDS